MAQEVTLRSGPQNFTGEQFEALQSLKRDLDKAMSCGLFGRLSQLARPEHLHKFRAVVDEFVENPDLDPEAVKAALARDWQNAYEAANLRPAPPVTWDMWSFCIDGKRKDKISREQLLSMRDTLLKRVADGVASPFSTESLPKRPRGRPRKSDSTIYANAKRDRSLRPARRDARRGREPEDLTGRVFKEKWKALYRAAPISPAKEGAQTRWMCRCLKCDHEQWILPLNLKGECRVLCRGCEYPKACSCGKPIEQDGGSRRQLCDECRTVGREERTRHRSRRSAAKTRIAIQLARSHGFDPSPGEGPAWRAWAESLGVKLDDLAKEILEDVATDCA